MLLGGATGGHVLHGFAGATVPHGLHGPAPTGAHGRGLILAQANCASIGQLSRLPQVQSPLLKLGAGA